MANVGYSESGQGSNERGPGSFSLQLPGGIQAASGAAGQAQSVRVGVTGGQTSGSVRGGGSSGSVGGGQLQRMVLPEIQIKVDPTAQLLGKLANQQFAAQVKRVEEQKFIEGASRAAAGQAMVEIANEQPWYSRIFGDSALVEGARAYTVKTGASKWVGDHIAAMPELAKKGPDAIPEYLHASMEQMKTGDAMTDQVMMSEMLGQVPGLIKEHTKQHYIHMQTQAKEARRDAMTGVLTLVEQSAMGKVDLGPEGAANLANQIISTLAPVPGADPESHYQDTKDVLFKAAASGQFHAVSAVARMGYVDKLRPQDQMDFELAMRRAAPAALTKVMGAMEPELMSFARDLPTMLPEDMAARYAALNNRASELSGVPQDIVQMYTPSERLQGFSQQLGDVARASAQRATAEQKQAEALIKSTALSQALKSGSLTTIDNVQSIVGATDKDVQQAATTTFYGLPPAERGAFLGQYGDKTWDVGKNFVADQWNQLDNEAKEFNPKAFGELMAVWSSLKNPRAQAAYFGERANDMDAMMNSVAVTGNAEASYRGRKVAVQLMKDRLPEDADQLAKNEIGEQIRDIVNDKMDSGIYGRSMNYVSGIITDITEQTSLPKPDLSDNDLRYAESIVMGYARRSPSVNPDPKYRAANALGMAQAAGAFTVVHRSLIFNENPTEAKATTLGKVIGGSEEEGLIMLSNLLEIRGKENGINPDNRIITRVRTAPGKPLVYHMIGFNKDGTEKYAVVTSDQVAEHRRTLHDAVRTTRAVGRTLQDISANAPKATSLGEDIDANFKGLNSR